MTANRAIELFDRRALGRALSRAARATTSEVVRDLARTANRAPRIGVTGAPGVGKSTLIGRLARHRIERSAPLAVIAVDPSSPRSGGSLLGDRVRMEDLADDPRLYIRSLPSGRAHDGLGDNLPEVLAAVDGFNFTEIILETVGVGQTGYGVRQLVDVEVLVVMPGLGDSLQAMKAGILETPDVIVINKAELPGAELTMAELRSVMATRASADSPQLLTVSKDDDNGVRRLSEVLDAELERARQRTDESTWRRRVNRYRTQSLVSRELAETLAELPEATFDRPLEQIYRDVIAHLARAVGGER
ncbi:MAG: hypothetical protein M0015_08640 [Betaproteobacteria bacterium]|nr:hypothetical protein [Betaproteobacteria bacterium]